MMNIRIYETNTQQETEAIGKEIGEKVEAGTFYALNGDLGVGKTVFTKGFAKGLAIAEHITSPTFTLMNIYEGRLPLYHFDLYRLTYEEELYDIGYEDYFFGQGVCLVEWAERFLSLLPREYIEILIEKDYEKGDNYRKITIKKGETL